MSPERFDLRQINFGKASAEIEGAQSPELLIGGFIDPGDIARRARTGSEFLVLGYKGSGKTAVSEHLRLTALPDSETFVTQTFLRDFPYTSFAHILQGDGAPATRYPTVWSWLLLLTVLDSYTRDNGAPSNDDGEFLRVTDELRRRGVLPARNLAEMTLKSSKKSFKVQLPSILEMTFEQPTVSNVDVAFVQFVENLRSLVSQFETPNRHIVIIDGLDDVLIEKEVQYEAVGALVLEAARLNHLFTSSGAGTKIICYVALNYTSACLAQIRTRSGKMPRSSWIGITTRAHRPTHCS
jgi:hypothetical protein